MWIAIPERPLVTPLPRDQPVDKVRRLVGKGQRIPSEAVWRRWGLIERRAAKQAVVDPTKSRVHRRRPNAVKPGPPVVVTWRGERRAGNLLGVKAVRRLLRRVLALRQGALRCLGGVLVAKTGQIAALFFLHAHSRGMITFSSTTKLLIRPMNKAPSACSRLASGEALARSIAARSSYQSSAIPSITTAVVGMSGRVRSSTMCDCT